MQSVSLSNAEWGYYETAEYVINHHICMPTFVAMPLQRDCAKGRFFKTWGDNRWNIDTVGRDRQTEKLVARKSLGCHFLATTHVADNAFRLPGKTSIEQFLFSGWNAFPEEKALALSPVQFENGSKGGRLQRNANVCLFECMIRPRK